MVTQNMLRTYDGKIVIAGEKKRFVTTLNLIKCLKQIKKIILKMLFTSTYIFKLLSNIITMLTSGALSFYINQSMQFYQIKYYDNNSTKNMFENYVFLGK